MKLSFGTIEGIYLEDHNKELHDIRDLEPEDYITFLKHLQVLKIAHDVLLAGTKLQSLVKKEQPMETKDDGYGIFLSPCRDCYKRSFSTVVGNKGRYCSEGIWDSRGTDKDGGKNLRGKCDKQFVIEDA